MMLTSIKYTPLILRLEARLQYIATMLCLLLQRVYHNATQVTTAVKVGVPKLGNCLEIYTCSQARAQACIHFQCTRSGQACAHAVHKLGTGLGTCVHFQAVSKLGHSNFYSRAQCYASDNLETDHDLFMRFSATWSLCLRVYTLGLLITCTHACNLAGIIGL